MLFLETFAIALLSSMSEDHYTVTVIFGKNDTEFSMDDGKTFAHLRRSCEMHFKLSNIR